MTVSAKIGFGRKVKGEIVVLGEPGVAVESYLVNSSLSDKILLLLSYAPRELLEKAGLVGVRGVIVPSIHWRDFNYFKDSDDFTLLVLTKFGKLDVSKELSGKLLKLNGKEGELDGEGKKLEV